MTVASRGGGRADPARRGLLLGGGVAAVAAAAFSPAGARSPGGEPNATRAGRLDLRDVQVLFVDLQPALVAQSRTTSPQAIAAAAGVLARAARLIGLPTTFATAPEDGRPGTLIPELADYVTPATTFEHRPTDPFLVPAIVAALAAHRRATLVVAGFSAKSGMLQAALGGLAEDYRVFVPVDTTGSRSDRTKAAAFREIERAGATTTSTRSLLLRLTPEVTQSPGSDVLKMLGDI